MLLCQPSLFEVMPVNPSFEKDLTELLIGSKQVTNDRA